MKGKQGQATIEQFRKEFRTTTNLFLKNKISWTECKKRLDEITNKYEKKVTK